MEQERDIRERHVSLRLLPGEKERLEAAARARSIGISDLLREALAPYIASAPTMGVETSVQVR